MGTGDADGPIGAAAQMIGTEQRGIDGGDTMMNGTAARATKAKALCTFAATLFWTATATAQTQLWLAQFGSSEVDHAFAVAPDGAGGVWVVGETFGSLGTPNLGGTDAFFARYDDAGNQLWIRPFGTSEDDTAKALAPDGTGGMMVGGFTRGSLGGPNAGDFDTFVARHDSDGNQLWIRQFGSDAVEVIQAMVPDGAGGVIVTGVTLGDLGGANAGRSDVFIARYDNAGSQLWIRQFGTDELDEAYSLAPDGSGGTMIAGYTWGSLGGPHAGERDAFVARFSGAGDQLWIRQFGTAEEDAAHGLATDGAGGVMVAGWTSGGLGGLNAGGSDAYLARFSGAGEQLWLRQFGSNEDEWAMALASDGEGGTVIAGYTYGNLGGPNAGKRDVFIARIDGTSTQRWIRQFGTSASDFARGLVLDSAEHVTLAGYTEGDLGRPTAGRRDAFMTRFEIDSCYADCDRSTGNGVLDIFDFLCFQNSFVNSEPYACDCDTSTGLGVCDVFDFLCFQDAFVAGCP